MRKNTNLGDFISEKLNEINPTPKPEVWDNITAALDAKERKPFFDKKYLLALLLLLGGYLLQFPVNALFLDNKTPENTTTKTIIKEVAPKIVTLTDTIYKENKEVIFSNKRLIKSTDAYDLYEECATFKVHKNKKITTNNVVVNSGNSNNNGNKNSNKNSNGNKNADTKNEEANLKTLTSNVEEISENTIKNDSIEAIVETKANDTILIADKEKKEKPNKTKREYKKTEVVKKSFFKKLIQDNTFLVSGYVGPTIYGSLTKGSSINSTFDSMEKTHPITASYGIYLRTMFDNYGFRFGIGNTTMLYGTNLVKTNNNWIGSYQNIVLETNPTQIESAFANDSEVTLFQKLSFDEYSFHGYYQTNADAKIGVDVFAGFSMQYLKRNELYLHSDNVKRMDIGYNHNISQVSFALEGGLGIYYKLDNHFQIDVNPIFKKMIHTFDKKSNYNPYYFAIQTGVTYKF